MIPRLASLPVVKSEAIMERKSMVVHAMIGKKASIKRSDEKQEDNITAKTR